MSLPLLRMRCRRLLPWLQSRVVVFHFAILIHNLYIFDFTKYNITGSGDVF